MADQLKHVGIREFRETLAQCLDSPSPVAITRHGQTVGYYIPTRSQVNEQELLSLRRAIEELEALLVDHGISEDEVVREFRSHRLQS